MAGGGGAAVGDPRWDGYRVASWIGLLLLGLGAARAAAQGRWLGALTFAGFALAAAAVLAVRAATGAVPAVVSSLVVLAIVVNAAGYVWDLWYRIDWFDKVVHGYTIGALSLLGTLLAYHSMLDRFSGYRAQLFLAVASLGVAVGGLWEVAEWLYDLVVPGNAIKGKQDTITDIIMDTIGAVLAGWLVMWVRPLPTGAPTPGPERIDEST